MIRFVQAQINSTIAGIILIAALNRNIPAASDIHYKLEYEVLVFGRREELDRAVHCY